MANRNLGRFKLEVPGCSRLQHRFTVTTFPNRVTQWSNRIKRLRRYTAQICCKTRKIRVWRKFSKGKKREKKERKSQTHTQRHIHTLVSVVPINRGSRGLQQIQLNTCGHALILRGKKSRQSDAESVSGVAGSREPVHSEWGVQGQEGLKASRSSITSWHTGKGPRENKTDARLKWVR